MSSEKQRPTDAELNEDWYALLMVPQDASVGAIKKSFRKLALKYHPDKNTKDPKAPELFAKFTKIKDFLLDEQIKGEYDEKRKAKQAKAKLDAARSATMGERRRRFKVREVRGEIRVNRIIHFVREKGKMFILVCRGVVKCPQDDQMCKYRV